MQRQKSKNQKRKGANVMRGTEITYAPDYAHNLPLICRAKGLFKIYKNRKRIENENFSIDVDGKYKTHTIYGYQPLDVFDMCIIQILVAYAGINQLEAKYDTVSDAGLELRSKLQITGKNEKAPTCIAYGYMSEALKHLGKSANSQNIKLFRDSLKRLSAVKIEEKTKDNKGGYNVIDSGCLLSYRYDTENKHGKSDGRFVVALNPKFLNRLIGYTYIDMREVRELVDAPDVTKIIHQWLCGYVDRDDPEKSISIDKLMAVVWTDTTAKPKSKNKRIGKVYAALAKIAGIGWVVNRHAGKITVRRPTVAENRRQIGENDKK
jgi:hypothetical protein